MSREEFLHRLEDALEGRINTAGIRNNLNYYNQYILDEIGKGRSEEEVVDSLGDPWAIARTISDAADGTDQEVVYEENWYSSEEKTAGQDYRREPGRQNPGTGREEQPGLLHMLGFDNWWKKLLLLLTVVLIVVVAVSVITGIIRFLAPVLIPVVIALILIRLISGGKRK